jgi:hypothetical protein
MKLKISTIDHYYTTRPMLTIRYLKRSFRSAMFYPITVRHMDEVNVSHLPIEGKILVIVRQDLIGESRILLNSYQRVN